MLTEQSSLAPTPKKSYGASIGYEWRRRAPRQNKSQDDPDVRTPVIPGVNAYDDLLRVVLLQYFEFANWSRYSVGHRLGFVRSELTLAILVSG